MGGAWSDSPANSTGPTAPAPRSCGGWRRCWATCPPTHCMPRATARATANCSPPPTTRITGRSAGRKLRRHRADRLSPPTIDAMDFPFQDLWLPAVRNRMVLFANHVLTACPPAVERLRAHAGKAVRVDVSGWPGLIPVPPPLTLRITPAGLFEGVETADEAAVVPDLNVRIDASDPAKVAGNVFKGGL